MSQETIDAIYDGLEGGREGAARLLADLGYDTAHPHATTNRAWREADYAPMLNLVMNCARPRRRHRIQLESRCRKTAERVASVLGASAIRIGDAGWRVATESSSFELLVEQAALIRRTMGDGVDFRETANFPQGRFDVMPASNLCVGMEVPVIVGEHHVVAVVSSVIPVGDGPLVDISIPEYGNYVANGIVTHNSIYGWRGAQPGNLEKFATEFNAQVFELTYNHRSTSRIVDFSRKVIDQYPAPMRTSALQSTRPEGHHPSVYVYYDNEAEARAISTWCRDLMNQGVPAREIAVLFRTNAQTQPVEEAFTESRLGYTVVGAMSFYDRKEVRDALSFVRVLVNDMDVPSFRRSLLCVPGVGDSSVRDLVGIMNQESCGPLAAIARYCSGKSGDRAEMLQRYADAMYQMQQMRPEEGIKLAADEFLTAKYASDQRAQDRMENVEALYNVAAKFATASQFITSVSLVSSSDEEHQGVCLATCHAVKGLEFSAVWVAGVEDGLFPHVKADSDEEENRLLYVACTRAKDILSLSWCRMRKHWGKTSTTDPSPYLVAMGAAK